MADILIEFAELVSSGYQGFIQELFTNIIAFMITIMTVKLFLELLFMIFPFTKRIAELIFLPFNVLHQWSHMHKAKQINQRAVNKRLKRVQKEKIEPIEKHFSSKLIVKPTFSMGIGDRENTGIIILPTEELTIKEVTGLAYAPAKYGFFITALVLFFSPTVLFKIPVFTVVFALIHLYALLGSLIFLFPSQEDYRLIINSIMTNSTLSPWYVMYGLPLLILGSTIQILFYEQIGFPDYWYINVLKKLIIVIVVYYIGLITIIGYVGPNVSLKTQKDSLLVTGETKLWKEEQEKQLIKETALKTMTEEQWRRQQMIVEVLVADEENYE